jgi:N-acetylglucosamine kinase-like BadF-type ATPase
VQIDAIHFYGAGCIKGQTDSLVHDALVRFWGNCQVEINDDMLGAARALFGAEAGIACILGTGANSAYYDGQHITDKVPTLGFILGDEGSGAYLGKNFLNCYFKREFPSQLEADIAKDLKLFWPDVLQSVYKQAFPNRYLASFAPYLYSKKHEPYIASFLTQCFSDFFRKNVCKYDNYTQLEVGAVGSVAYHFSEFLTEAALKTGISSVRTLQSPLKALVRFHTDDNE